MLHASTQHVGVWTTINETATDGLVAANQRLPAREKVEMTDRRKAGHRVRRRPAAAHAVSGGWVKRLRCHGNSGRLSFLLSRRTYVGKEDHTKADRPARLVVLDDVLSIHIQGRSPVAKRQGVGRYKTKGAMIMMYQKHCMWLTCRSCPDDPLKQTATHSHKLIS
jgi:hypothetical protein